MNPLDNIVWHALSGPQAKFSAGGALARRYAPGFSPMIAFADPARPDFAAIEPHCTPGERFYIADWRGTPPPGWQVEADASMHRMVWEGPQPPAPAAADLVALGPEHAAQALALAELTKPGPFGPRTIELGEYFGVFEGGALVAMAGERMQAEGLREVSGVCTHPDRQGAGLARRLMLWLIHRQCGRGERPFLHVMTANTTARGLYERMGFRTHCEAPVRVVSYRPTAPS